MITDKNKIFFWIFVFSILAIFTVSLFRFEHVMNGDAPTYREAIQFLEHGTVSDHVSYRILTTFFGLESVILFSKIFGSIEAGWLVLNTFLCLGFVFVFYHIVYKIFSSAKTAFLASLFLATNYAVVVFGLGYWMDPGGWFFYILSLYFTLLYTETGDQKKLLYSAVSIGVGGLFKEYAFLGIIPIAAILIYENWPNFLVIIKKAIAPALIVLLPVTLVFLYVYQKFNYTYLTWFSVNQDHFVQVYSSRLVEYIKSLGSLYTFLAFAVLAGIYYFIRNGEEIVPEKKLRFFILSVVLSSLPVFIWPAIIQRVLFIPVPGALLLASFAFKKLEKIWWIFLPLLFAYTLANFTMDSYVLPNFNLPLASINKHK